MRNTLLTPLFIVILAGAMYAQPANDTCAGAIDLSTVLTDLGTTICQNVAPGDTPITTLFASTDGATDSTPGADTGTGCSTQGADYWYSWTATTTDLYWQYQNAGGDPGIYVYSGACGALVEVDCLTTFSAGSLNGWNIGDNLIIQIHDFGTTTGVDLDFCLNAVQPCVFPTVLVETTCAIDDAANFYVTLDFQDLGLENDSGYTIDVGGPQADVTAIGIYTYGPFPIGTAVDASVTGIDDPTCTGTVPGLDQNCECDLTAITVASTTQDCAGDDVTLTATLPAINPGMGYDELQNCTTAFVDIMGTGAALGLGDDGETTFSTTNSYLFYGVSYSDFSVGNNGDLYFNAGLLQSDLSNEVIDGSGTSNNPGIPVLLPLWDDWDSEQGDVYWEEVGTTLIVQWQDRVHFSGAGSVPGDGVTYQLQLDAAGTITFIYTDLDEGESEGNTAFDNAVAASIGIDNGDGVNFIQTSFNTAIGFSCVSYTIQPDFPCDFIGWFTDINDPAGSMVGTTNPLVVTPSMTTTYYGLSDCVGAQCYSSTVVTSANAIVANCVDGSIQCNGDTDGMVSVTASGGAAPLTYAWSSGGTAATESSLGAGTYTVVVTDANGCSTSCSATVTGPTALVATCTGSNLACAGALGGTVEVAVAGGTAPYTYLWNTAATTAFVSGLTVGTFDVVVTDANGCTATCMTEVTSNVDGTPPVFNYCQPFPFFFGLQADGTINIPTDAYYFGATDNCTAPGDIVLTGMVNDFTCADVGPNIITLVATDEEDNSSTCIVEIVIIDAEPPALTCPSSSGNLIPNGDFDSGDYAGWSFVFGNAFIEPFQGFPNIPASKLFGPFSSAFGASGYGQNVPCAGGDWVCLSGSMLTPGGDDITGTANFVEIKLEFIDGLGNIINGPFGTPVGVMDGSVPVWTWIPYSGCLQAPPGTTSVNAVVVFVQPNFEGGAVFVDNINMEKLTPMAFDVTNLDCTTDITLVPPVPADACGIASFTNSYNGTADASDNYPMGQTLVTYTAVDVNGLVSECSIVIDVTDPAEPAFAPMPVGECSMVGLSVNLDDFISNGATGVTYSWLAADNADVTGESTTATAGNTIADVIINTSGSVQTVVYSVTPTSSNGCEFPAFEVSVDIYSEIAAEVSCSCGLNAAGTQVVPLATLANITGGIPQADNSSYSLVSTDGTLSSATASLGGMVMLELTSLTGGDYTVTITDDAGCESEITGTCVDCSFGGEFVLVDPCSCNNDQSGNGAMDGTFGETVQVVGPAGFMLVVGAGSIGMNGVAIGDAIPEVAPGVYEIMFDHVDNIGYTLFVDLFTAAGGTVPLLDAAGLPISGTNACQYPILSDPVLPQLDFCVTDGAISLGGATMETQGHAGTITTTVNGFETETFDPASAGPGQHLVQFSFDGDLVSNNGGTQANPAIPGCFTYVTQFVNVHSGGQLTCNDHVNISVNEDCSLSVITADAFLEGGAQDQFYGFQILGIGDLPIELNNSNDPNHISNYMGQTLTYEVYDVCTGNSCWGTVTLEDKIAPEPECPCETPYLADGVTPNPDCVFYCYEVWDLEILEDKQKNNNELLPETDESYPTDNCLEFGEPRLITYEYNDGNCGEKIVTRKMAWDYINADGTVQTIECVQNFLFDNLSTNNIGTTANGTWDDYENIFVANSGDRPMFDFYTPEPVVNLTCGTDTDPASIAEFFDLDTPGRPVGKERDDHDDTPNILEHNEGIPYAYPYVVIKGWSNRYHAKAIDNNLCNIYQTYTDLDYDACSDDCKGTRKVGRTWSILDWCTATVIEFQQTIKVVDTEAPSISGLDHTVSVDPWSCTVDFEAPYPDHLHDNCDTDVSWYLTGPAGITIEGNTAKGLPKGVTVLYYEAVDCCGNVAKTPFAVTVVDNTPPTVVVKQNLVVQLTNIDLEDNTGIAKLFAVDVDNFSHDGCSDIHFEIRRPDATAETCGAGSSTFNNDGHLHDDEYDLDGGAYVKFCCADVVLVDSITGVSYGMVDVILRVWDDGDMDGIFGTEGDNYNESWSTVRVEDKLAPVVICPPTAELACHEDYLDYDLTGRPYASKTCSPFACDEEPSDRFKKKPANSAPFLGEEIAAYNPSCRRGAIERTWNCGEYECTQWIIMRDTEDGPLDVTFPDDLTVNCMDTDPGTPSVVERLCELSGVSLESDTFNFEDGACFKILHHWTVINWCDYDANDSDLNDSVDQDDDGFVPGFYQHTQVVKLIDTEKPVLTVVDTCFAANTDCVGTGLEIWAGASDNGVCGSAWLKWEVEIDMWSDWEVDYSYSSFLASDDEFYVAPSSGDIHITLPDDLPMGCASNHRVLWTVHDGCGNTTSRTSFFTVEDKKKPTPYMLNLSTALMQNGQVELWARDFDAGSFDNCTDQGYLAYTFSSTVPPQLLDPTEEDPWYDVDGVAKESDYEKGEAEEWNASTLSSARIFDLDDLALAESNGGFLPLQVHVWDLCGNQDFAVVNLKLIFNEEGQERANIAGSITTEQGAGIENVKVTALSDQPGYPYVVSTDDEGSYMFEYNPMYEDYSLSGEKNDDWLNGVTTLDLVLIQRHVLGLQTLEGAYNIIAADANNDEKVSAIDLIHLRKLILGVYAELPNNDSWKFMDSDLTMNADNPWPFDESLTINDLASEMMTENFVGVKVGDVNGSVILGLTGNNVSSRNGKNLEININQIDLGQGERRLEFSSTNFNDLAGFQFTLEASATEITEVTSGAISLDDTQVSNINGALAFSWNSDKNVSTGTATLFSVTIKSNGSALRISDRVANSEAYVGDNLETINVALAGNAIAVNNLGQNEPNPWRAQTTINFSLAEAGEATITVYDVTGKTLMNSTADYAAGDHQYVIKDKVLAGASGVMYYMLQSGEFSSTKKMILIE